MSAATNTGRAVAVEHHSAAAKSTTLASACERLRIEFS
jgi:hypothetical protein